MRSLRLFISSPGDVAQERELCRRVVARINRAFTGRVHLDCYFWEYEPMMITVDYQEQIPPPSGFDVFVCILWSRLGSRLHSRYRLPDGRLCRSGTEFEFIDAVEGRKRTGDTPDILVWVNKAPPMIPIEAAARKHSESTVQAGTDFLSILLGQSGWISKLQEKDLVLGQEFLNASDDFIDRLSNTNPPTELLRHWVGAIANLGYSHLLQGSGAEAIEAQRRAIQTVERLIEVEPDNIENQHYLAENYYLLGKHHILANDPTNAQMAYRAGLDRLTGFLAKNSAEVLRANWIKLKIALAYTLMVDTSVEEGKKAFHELFAQLLEWGKGDGEWDDREHIVNATLQSAEALHRVNAYDDATKVLNGAETLLADMEESPRKREFLTQLKESQAVILSKPQKWLEASVKYRDALALYPPDSDTLAPSVRTRITDLLDRVIHAELSAERAGQAYKAAEKRALITESLVELDPANMSYVERHYRSMVWLGKASIASADAENAAYYFEGATENIYILMENVPREKFTSRLFEHSSRAANAYITLQQYDDARRLLDDAMFYRDELIDETKAAPDEQSAAEIELWLARTELQLGSLLVAENPERRDEGIGHLRAALARFDRLDPTEPLTEVRAFLRTLEE